MNMTMKTNRGFFLGIILSFVVSLGLHADAALIKTINGRVASVDTENAVIYLQFKHPATGETKQLVFQTDQNTGFRENLDFSELKENDPVSIDYEENSEDILLALYVEKVQLTGPPDGVEKFRGL